MRVIAGIPAARLGLLTLALGHVVMVSVMVMTPLHMAHGDAGLEVTDRILLSYQVEDGELVAALSEHAPSIQRETLALSLTRKAGGTPTQLNGIDLSYSLIRATPAS